MTETPPDPIAALKRIAYLLYVLGEPSFRGSTFARAARSLRELTAPELAQSAADGSLRQIEGVGPAVERVVVEALAGNTPSYLLRLEQQLEDSTTLEALALASALRGDLHTHSDWSDGRYPIEVMAEAARNLGHDYIALTDHSPRLTIARGLSRERLIEQLSLLEPINTELAPFRILSGIETDILADGTLDQDPDLLARLDVVVGSAHSLLRQPAAEMTPRMLAAIADPNLDVLGHCTGRIITGRRGRPESEFDAEAVFAACARYDKAVEINCSPARLDPPRRLLSLAVAYGCKIAINTDAHSTDELQWQLIGVRRAAECGVPVESVVNTWPREQLLAWTASHAAEPATP